MCMRRWRKYNVHIFKFFLVVLVIVLFTGEIGCFWLCFATWRIPQAYSDSLNLLFVSDSQIQGYKGERPGILGYMTRFDADWYLKKAFFMALTCFYPDAVIHLGDVLDEGFVATAEEFQEYKTRHDRIFDTPAGICRIHIAGDNDIGGESSDIITKGKVARFSENFGSLDDVIKLKNTFQMVKLIEAVQPYHAFSGHIHERATIDHKIGKVTFTEHVVPTCSYRMGTEKMSLAVAVIGVDGSIVFSELPLPTRYPYLKAYLGITFVFVVFTLQWLISTIVFHYKDGFKRKIGFIFKLCLKMQ
ncbi:metallophosphoesterase 1-like isoform X4 [Stylophora pistillata]|uniref:metallophosphoesterase 1-like isoform X4 n=1 Tax=Stylophora pistillata TaxID=50429 RepID=UPI000C044DA8|nr:metallophosphoesterase 1-like isoform X4 [Stylophora pistillata]